jgi:hypothetical protein
VPYNEGLTTTPPRRRCNPLIEKGLQPFGATLMVRVNVILAEFVALQPVVVSVEVEVVRVEFLAGGLPVVEFIVHKNNLL